jgi:hypothetical protein
VSARLAFDAGAAALDRAQLQAPSWTTNLEETPR